MFTNRNRFWNLVRKIRTNFDPTLEARYTPEGHVRVDLENGRYLLIDQSSGELLHAANED